MDEGKQIKLRFHDGFSLVCFSFIEYTVNCRLILEVCVKVHVVWNFLNGHEALLLDS